MYSVINVDIEKCTGCRTCELACSLHNYGECNPSRSRIFVVRDQDEGLITTVPVVCQQCEKPLCLNMCPAQAISRDPETHAVVIDEDKCLGCRTCVYVCPFGAPSVDPRLGVAQKCDLCGGSPSCVAICPKKALSYVGAEEESLRRKRTRVERYLSVIGTRG
ncbi:MAG: 4Fe-4S dicluster domain-containing protein [Actinobacteria bacterium]|nr:4Fe-4S dicluster domain-containing protein [Actinomycetota bacterium]